MPSQGAITSQVAHHKPLRAKLPITRCHCVPSFPSQGAIMCHVAHRQVLLCAYVAYNKVPSCGMMPTTRCNPVQNLLCQVSIVWLRCLLRGGMGGYRIVPPYAHRKVHSYANRLPLLTSCPFHGCQCVLSCRSCCTVVC